MTNSTAAGTPGLVPAGDWVADPAVRMVTFAVRNFGLRTVTGRIPLTSAGVIVGPSGQPVRIATPRPAVVHHETDTYITTYTALDPLRSAGGMVTLDGFFGWPLTAVAS